LGELYMKFPRLRNPEIDLIKADVEEIKTQLSELLSCLPVREAQIMAALEANKEADSATAELLKEQEVEITRLKVLNTEKSKTLNGMTRWIILIILGLMAATTKYEFQFEKGTGIVIRPDSDTGVVIPVLYAVALVAVATNHENRLGNLIDRMGGGNLGT
jgi:hypothetical protein